MLHIHIIYNI